MNDAWTNDLGFAIRDDGATDGDIVGVSWKPISATKNYTRSSARRAYLDPVINRPNLHVLVRHFVSKVLVENNQAKGVEVISRDDSAGVIQVIATQEVVLAAGAIHTPQILQLSGIGPAKVLQRLNITVVHHLPGVGANYQDHSSVRATDAFQCQFPPLMYITD